MEKKVYEYIYLLSRGLKKEKKRKRKLIVSDMLSFSEKEVLECRELNRKVYVLDHFTDFQRY